jgi:hypothetical protein
MKLKKEKSDSRKEVKAAKEKKNEDGSKVVDQGTVKVDPILPYAVIIFCCYDTKTRKYLVISFNFRLIVYQRM